MNIETWKPGQATVLQKLQEVFGCKPFAGKIMTWSEVASRLIYVAFLGPKEVVGVFGNPGAIGLGIKARQNVQYQVAFLTDFLHFG